MNSRAFLRFRMLIELVIAISLVVGAVDVELVHISNRIWLDLPCRLLFAVLAIVIFIDVVKIHRDARA